MKELINPLIFSETIPKEYTEEEIREIYLRAVWERVRYWDDDRFSRKDALEGVAFSILSMMDGCSLDVPPYKVSPIIDIDDINFDLEHGNNIYPMKEIDIGGGLHEMFYKYKDEETSTVGNYDRFKNVYPCNNIDIHKID